MTVVVDVVARLAALRWNGRERVAALGLNDRLFHHLPATHKLFEEEWLNDRSEGDFFEVDLRTDQSVTWEFGGTAYAHDAFLKIDRVNGFIEVRRQVGIIALTVRMLTIPNMVSGDGRVFASTAEHIPYNDNRSHAEVWTFEPHLRPKDWQTADDNRRVPEMIRKLFRRLVSIALIDAIVANREAHIAVHPRDVPEFKNIPETGPVL